MPLFNPLNEDFHATYDASGENKKFVINAKEVAYFEPYIAKHIKKHLANKMFDIYGIASKDRDVQMKQFMADIEL